MSRKNKILVYTEVTMLFKRSKKTTLALQRRQPIVVLGVIPELPKDKDGMEKDCCITLSSRDISILGDGVLDGRNRYGAREPYSIGPERPNLGLLG